MSDGQTAKQPDLQEQLQEDPYAIYAQWRRAGRVQWLDPLQHWLITGHQEVMAALRDTRLVSPSGLDATAHGRWRTQVQSVFTPAVVEQFRPHAEKVAGSMLTEAGRHGELDVATGFASPLAVSVATALLGLPSEDEHVIGAWVHEVSEGLVPSLGHCGRLGETGPMTAPDKLRRSLSSVVAARRAEPRNDLISRLVQVEEGDRLADDEVLDLCVELLVSSHDSTVNLVGNGVKALLENPVQLDRLRADSSLITTGVEELLRYDSPVQIIARRPVEDAELGGKTLRQDEPILVVVGAANRDPEAFAEPDTLDLSRSPNHHVAFGRGMRTCLGAPLARMAGQVAIGSLFVSFPQVRLAGTPTRRIAVGARGFTSLPVAL
jgi:cytochrome P450